MTNYAQWKSLHVIASLGTLAAVVIKLGLHWRWIVAAARRYIFRRPQQPAPAATGLGRREFLRFMGSVGVFAAIAAGSAMDALAQTASTASAATPSTQSTTTIESAETASTLSQSTSACTVRCPKGCSYPGSCRRYTDSNNTGRCDLGECV